MELDNIKSLIKIAKDEGLAELKYETKDFKVTVTLPGSQQIYTHSIPGMPVQASAASAVQKPAAETVSKANLHEITSPFVGTFYLAPAPDKPPFVKIGDKVSKGATLCILEAMKIMNEIESDVAGELAEICVENESLVEYGQVLFRIKK